MVFFCSLRFISFDISRIFVAVGSKIGYDIEWQRKLPTPGFTAGSFITQSKIKTRKIRMEWEAGIIESMQSSLGGIGKALGSVFAFIGGEYGLMLLLVIVLFCWKKEAGQRLALIIAALHVWFAMIKAVVKRPRPYVEYPDRVKALSPVDTKAALTNVAAQGYSFPSMHSGSSTASYISLAREIKKKWFWILAVALILLVGISRVVTGNHYPTDVLAGWALGFAVIGIFALLERVVRKEWVRHLILLGTALPGLFFVRTEDYYTSLGLMIGAIAAIAFERRFVNYQDTRNLLAMILRAAGAFVIYFGLNTLLKMPFNKDFLASASLGALLIRTARYTVIMFLIMGVYPKIFPLFERKR